MYNYFIEKNLPFMFRYKYSNPNKIRTCNILSYDEVNNIIVVNEKGRIKQFKTEGIHFETNDLFPVVYESVYSEYEEFKKVNKNKEQFLRFAMDNHKTVSFVYDDNTYLMAPYKFSEDGVVFYDEKQDAFKTFLIDDITFVPILQESKTEESKVEEPETETEEINDDEDIFYLESDGLFDGDDLDISAIDEINEW